MLLGWWNCAGPSLALREDKTSSAKIKLALDKGCVERKNLQDTCLAFFFLFFFNLKKSSSGRRSTTPIYLGNSINTTI